MTTPANPDSLVSLPEWQRKIVEAMIAADPDAPIILNMPRQYGHPTPETTAGPQEGQ